MSSSTLVFPIPRSRNGRNLWMERLKLGLVGIGGFGQVLLKVIRKLQEEDRVELAAVCDICLEKFLAHSGGKASGYDSHSF